MATSYYAWYGGKCKKCGSDVEEKRNTDKLSDYMMSRCINSQCVNHEWRFCYDDEFLDYYDHK